MLIEEWVDIEGFESMYQVSNFGRVKSLKRKKEIVLKNKITRSGYAEVNLYKDKYYFCLVHRLVASNFIKNPQNKPQVNHVDGNKMNNRVCNLEWVTPKENVQHALVNGLHKTGSKSTSSKLNDNDIINIQNLYLTGEYSHEKLGGMYEVHPTTIGKMLKGSSWKNRENEYKEEISEMAQKKYGGSSRKGKIILTDDQIKEAVSLFKKGISKRKIANKFGLSHTTINRYLKSKVGD